MKHRKEKKRNIIEETWIREWIREFELDKAMISSVFLRKT